MYLVYLMYNLQVIVKSWEIKKFKFTTSCMNLDKYNTINGGLNQQAHRSCSMELFYLNQDLGFKI